MAEAYTIDGTSNQLLENTVTGPQNNAITWAYDEVGNRIQESAINNNNNDALVYQYGDDNRLNQITRDGAAIGAYVHNAFGQRTQKTAIINNQLETVHFHYDLAGTLIAETDGTGALIRDCIYLDGAPIALITNDPAQPTGTFFYHTDHLGTPQMLTNGEQTPVWSADYNPFGEVDIVTEVVSNPLRFPGQYFDEETRLHYNYFRDYDPATGRYIQSDPIGLEAGNNTYNYVFQNPMRYIDSFGLQTTVITTTDFGIGSHAAIHIDPTGNGSHDALLYDPNGGYIPSSNIPPGEGRMFEGDDANLNDFIDWHEESGSKVHTHPLNLTPEQELELIQRIESQPSSPPLGCAISVSAALKGICGIKPTWWPGNLADQVDNAICE